MLWALALEALSPEDRQRLETLAAGPINETTLHQVRQLYQTAEVFEKAHRLVDKYQERAEAIADEIEPEALRRLLYYLVDTVLERPVESAPAVVTPLLLAGVSLPTSS